MLKGDTGGAQEVGQVRDRRALTDVPGVKTRGEDEGVLEALSENVLRGLSRLQILAFGQPLQGRLGSAELVEAEVTLLTRPAPDHSHRSWDETGNP